MGMHVDLVYVGGRSIRRSSDSFFSSSCVLLCKSTQASSRELLKAHGHGEGPICGVGVPPFVTRRIGECGYIPPVGLSCRCIQA